MRAKAQRNRAVAAESDAEENYRLARGAVDRYLTNVSESSELQAYGLESLRRNLLETAREFYQQLAERDRAADPSEAQLEVAFAWDRLGTISRIVGDHQDAREAYRNELAILNGAAPQKPKDSALCQQQTASAFSNLVLVTSEVGQIAEATDAFHRALEVEERLLADDPKSSHLQTLHAITLDNFAQMLETTGAREEALKRYTQSLVLRRHLSEAASEDTDLHFKIMQSYVNLGAFHARAGELDEARADLSSAINIGETLAQRGDGNPEHKHGLASAIGNLAGVALLQDAFTEAKSLYDRELEIRKELATKHPNNLLYHVQLGSAYTNLGELEARQEHHAAALPHFERAIETLDWALDREPKHATARFFQSYTLCWCARSLDALGRSSDAIPMWKRAITLDDRHNPELRSGLARSRELTHRRHSEVDSSR